MARKKLKGKAKTTHTKRKVARDKAVTARDKAVNKMKAAKPNTKEWRQARRAVIRASSRVRKHGNVMRKLTGREMGEGTRYTGPTSEKTLRAIRRAEAFDPTLTKLPTTRTKWQEENIKWMNELGGREAWRAAWGEPGSDSYKRMQVEQARRMRDADVPPPPKDPIRDPIREPTGGFGTQQFDPNALSQYGGGYNRFSESVYPYAIPARDFIWQTDPTEQGLLASAMGRDDIAKMMLTGQYGPLAGQKYHYYGGRTGVNYGPTGGYGAGGVPLGQGGIPPTTGAGGGIGVGAGAGGGTTPANPFAVDPNQWTPPTTHGFELDPARTAGGQSPFMQWTIAEHQRIQDANRAAAAAAASSGPSMNLTGANVDYGAALAALGNSGATTNTGYSGIPPWASALNTTVVGPQ
jgi:hypothetical protein